MVAAAAAFAAPPFRDAATSGAETVVTILAAAVFAYAVHAALAEASTAAIVLVAAGGALAVLADPLWLPGVVAALLILGLLYGRAGNRTKVISVGLLVLALLLAPNRLSVADQNHSDVVADLRSAAATARVLEGRSETPRLDDFARPTAPDSSSVGLLEFIFGDHSFAVVVGATLEGVADVLGAFGEIDDPKLLAALGFVLSVAGFAYLLILPRLRMLALLPALLAFPELFFTGRGVWPPFLAGAAIWPAFVAGAGLVVYVALAVCGPAVVRHIRALSIGGRLPSPGRSAQRS